MPADEVRTIPVHDRSGHAICTMLKRLPAPYARAGRREGANAPGPRLLGVEAFPDLVLEWVGGGAEGGALLQWLVEHLTGDPLGGAVAI
jgi:hypothetical protein